MKTKFIADIKRFAKMGEKTGWTYIEIPSAIAQKIKPGNKRSFRVKGKLDSMPLAMKELLPMGGGDFIMPLNATIRKVLKKKHGEKLLVQIEEDKSEYVFNSDFLTCLNDEPLAKKHFLTLTGSHQRYFSKWIDGAKTEKTKANRIAQAVNALAKKWSFPEMIQAGKKEK